MGAKVTGGERSGGRIQATGGARRGHEGMEWGLGLRVGSGAERRRDPGDGGARGEAAAREEMEWGLGLRAGGAAGG